MVNDVPLDCSGAFCAINAENNGESAITDNPQINKKNSNSVTEGSKRKKGEIIQQPQEINNEIAATFFAPKYCEMMPLKTQAIPPQAIMKKDKNDMLMCFSG